jgi:hypothetical protein
MTEEPSLDVHYFVFTGAYMKFPSTFLLTRVALLILFAFAFGSLLPASAQFLDQGALTGVVQDASGAAIPGAEVTLTNPETSFTQITKSNASGEYVFSPIKIGTYAVTVKAQGFEQMTQKNIAVNIGQRADVNITLKPGAVSETVTVTAAPPLLQTQNSSTGETFTTQAINDTPLSSRNVIYLAQLSAGTTPSNGSRAKGTGDFSANGMRPEQNNFVLDGVDNNAVSADYLGGSSYVINPPPDALQQFQISTSNYSAEFGHSAGALVQASVKSGTNHIHGDVWEYLRNDYLDTHDWQPSSYGQKTPEYRQNLFGATLGFPIIKDKLFFFGDVQNNRIIIQVPQTPLTVPTPLERTGDFSELLVPANLNAANAVTLYEPQNNQTVMTCPARATTANPTGKNVLCTNQISTAAQNVLNAYPLPNSTQFGLDNQNYDYSLKQPLFVWQWDARADYNPTSKDQAFFRFSFLNSRGTWDAPLGPVLDGGGGNGSTNVSGTQINYGNNFVGSETHIFSPTVVNELRYAFNYSHFAILNPGYNNPNAAANLGLGGVPEGPSAPQNGGLPTTTISGGGGIASFGAHAYRPELEYADEYQLLDNVSWTFGNHSLRLGFSFQSIRADVLEPPSSHPAYTFNGSITSKPGTANTGSGVADFLSDNMSGGSISPSGTYNDAQVLPAAYVQDDWRVTRKLTLNLGVRYEYFQPYKEMIGKQGNFYVNSAGVATGSAVYLLPAQDQKNYPLNPAFIAALAKDNIALQYTNNVRLTSVSAANFAPRVGFAYTPFSSTVVRGGYGLFYQGQQQAGVAENMATNYPFLFSDSFPVPGGTNCTVGNPCANNGYTLETGFESLISQGLTSAFSTPGLVGTSLNIKTTYAMDYNLAVEQAFTNNFVFTINYVGNVARHLPSGLNSNATRRLLVSGSNQQYLPFPDFGGSSNLLYNGEAEYDALQVKARKRISHGLDFSANYTWSHALTDSGNPLDGIGTRDPNIIPIREDMTNDVSDTRHRFTFNGFYHLPVGHGERFLNRSNGVVDALLGGWSTNVTFQAQTGNPFSVSTSNQSNVVGGTTFAYAISNPFAAGGSPNPTNPSITCATATHTHAHWYNPCAFANPLPASQLNNYQAATNTSNPSANAPTSDAVAKLFLGGRADQVYGPGFRKLDMSLFKQFHIFEAQYLELRADAFNLTNTPILGQPSTASNNTAGGQITQARQLQLDTPNGRFFQLSAKYVF